MTGPPRPGRERITRLTIGVLQRPGDEGPHRHAVVAIRRTIVALAVTVQFDGLTDVVDVRSTVIVDDVGGSTSRRPSSHPEVAIPIVDPIVGHDALAAPLPPGMEKIGAHAHLACARWRGGGAREGEEENHVSFAQQ